MPLDGTAGSDIESGIGSSSATGVSDEGEGRNAGDHPISNYIATDQSLTHCTP